MLPTPLDHRSHGMAWTAKPPVSPDGFVGDAETVCDLVSGWQWGPLFVALRNGQFSLIPGHWFEHPPRKKNSRKELADLLTGQKDPPRSRPA